MHTDLLECSTIRNAYQKFHNYSASQIEMNDKLQITQLEALREALDSGTLRPVRRMLAALHPAEIGSLIESLPNAER